MVRIQVKLKENSYTIAVGSRTLDQLPSFLKALKVGTDAVILTNPVIRRLHGNRLAGFLNKQGFTVKFFEVPEGEKSKSALVAVDLINRIARYDVDKKIFVLILGGGVVGDLGGFVAATYKRGIPCVQVPTTFLAQIDSAIGGKVGVDLAVGKNLAGAFYQPKLVFSDVAVLKTLSERQVRNGLAEAIKYGVICDPVLFSFIEKNHGKLIARDEKALTFVVNRCAKIKAGIVSKDEKETKGLRTVLNFGHTVGHAIEAAGGYDRYHHGEAIALGMRVAAAISRELKLLKPKDESRLNGILTSVGLPQKIKGVQFKGIFEKMRHDKKFKAGRNRFVLAQAIGKVKVVENIPQNVIEKAVRQYLS